MSEARDASVIAESRRQIERLSKLGWYHSIELKDGTVIEGHQTVAQLRRRLAQFPVPEDLTGRRVLDIGAWDGWFSFEMERRGAQVVALDCARNTRLLEARALLGSRIDYRVGDICRLTWRDLGRFDIVLFFGVLYHLKHPLLALENVCGMCRDAAFIESFVSDPDPDGIPSMEFYETTELRGQLDNWVGPNASCLLAFCRTAGFARIHFESALGERAHVTAHRNWIEPPGTAPAPLMRCVENSNTHDHVFSSAADDYLTFYFTNAQPGVDCALNCESVFVEVGGYGSRPMYVARLGEGWLATAKLPPGLEPGWHEARLRTAGSAFCEPMRIGVDTLHPPQSRSPSAVRITRVADGKSFEDNRVRIGPDSALSVWAEGLPEDASADRIRLRLHGSDLPAIWLAPAPGAAPRQINALLPAGLEPRHTTVSVVWRGEESAPASVEICPFS